MLNEKQIERLKCHYKVPEKELIDMGLVKIPTVLLSGRLTKKEHSQLIDICYDTGIINRSYIFREYIANIIAAKKLNRKEVIRLKKKKISKDNEKHISVRVDSSMADDFSNICYKNKLSVDATLRFIAVQIIKEKGGKG